MIYVSFQVEVVAQEKAPKKKQQTKTLFLVQFEIVPG
jgi:hypothetical protein